MKAFRYPLEPEIRSLQTANLLAGTAIKRGSTSIAAQLRRRPALETGRPYQKGRQTRFGAPPFIDSKTQLQVAGASGRAFEASHLRLQLMNHLILLRKPPHK